MQIDKFGISHRTENELFSLLYTNPELNLLQVEVDDPQDFNCGVKELHYDHPLLVKYTESTESVEEFDKRMQSNWYMPDEYKNLDIAKWLLDKCETEEELQRVGQELLLFQDKNLLVLLQFMKYFVDTMKANKVVIGVGRGSSVASYCLYLLGVHRINSLYFGLDVTEFLK